MRLPPNEKCNRHRLNITLEREVRYMTDNRKTINGIVVGGPCNIRHEEEEKPIKANASLDIKSRPKDLPMMDSLGLEFNAKADLDLNIGILNGRLNISIKL